MAEIFNLNSSDMITLVEEAIYGIMSPDNLYDIFNMLLNGKRYICIDGRSNIGENFGIQRLELSCDGHSGDMVCIDHIEVSETGNGNGSKLMQYICNWADKNDITLTLTPSDDFGATSINRLIEFYKRFDFIKNTGKMSNFSTKQAMYRLPR